jgi:hypothetical protein
MTRNIVAAAYPRRVERVVGGQPVHRQLADDPLHQEERRAEDLSVFADRRDRCRRAPPGDDQPSV